MLGMLFCALLRLKAGSPLDWRVCHHRPSPYQASIAHRLNSVATSSRVLYSAAAAIQSAGAAASSVPAMEAAGQGEPVRC